MSLSGFNPQPVKAELPDRCGSGARVRSECIEMLASPWWIESRMGGTPFWVGVRGEMRGQGARDALGEPEGQRIVPPLGAGARDLGLQGGGVRHHGRVDPGAKVDATFVVTQSSILVNTPFPASNSHRP